MESSTPPPASSSERGYKRSWKNLLINKRYQLRFTLFMVGVSALLMIALGSWVKRVADNTTEVGLARVRGEACPPLPEAPAAAPAAPEPAPASPPPADPAASPAAPAAPGDAPPRARVLIDESSLTLTEAPMSEQEFAKRVAAHRACEARQAGLIKDLESRRRDIGWVLLASGLLLCGGLAVYGIKMTHRVAGPLYKIGLYFGQMREGRYRPVYPLRKGDELTEFYEHFKAAHAGVVQAETTDIERMRAVVAAAGAGPHAPEVAGALKELQAMIERKEQALE
ncbi:MAG: hypothetical protein R3B48_01095 [Kofleriaceae bacterium]